MDWQRLINQFLPVNPEDIASFAPPREMAQAIVTYNRALTNLKSQNGDIALIALRKLTATYPAALWFESGSRQPAGQSQANNQPVT